MGWAWSSGTQTLTWPLQEVMSRTSCSIGFLMRFTICAALIQSLLVGAALAGAQRPVVHWRNQRLSVESAGAPVVKILAEVARETGLRVEGADAQRQPADVHFANLSLSKALPQLLVNVNFALVERSCGRNSPCFTLIVLGEPEMVADHHDGSAQSMTRTESSSDAAEHLQ